MMLWPVVRMKKLQKLNSNNYKVVVYPSNLFINKCWFILKLTFLFLPCLFGQNMEVTFLNAKGVM